MSNIKDHINYYKLNIGLVLFVKTNRLPKNSLYPFLSLSCRLALGYIVVLVYMSVYIWKEMKVYFGKLIATNMKYGKMEKLLFKNFFLFGDIIVFS